MHQIFEGEKTNTVELALKKRRFILVTKQHEKTTVVENSDVSCSSIRSAVTVGTLVCSDKGETLFSNLIPADSALTTSA